MGQVLYPPHLVPEAIAKLPKIAVESTGDFIFGGVMGLPGYGPQENWAWLISFIRLEVYVDVCLKRGGFSNNASRRFFQVPVFILGIWGLWKGKWFVR